MKYYKLIIKLKIKLKTGNYFYICSANKLTTLVLKICMIHETCIALLVNYIAELKFRKKMNKLKTGNYFYICSAKQKINN
jgi:Uri superfamily endonuclease